MMREASGCRTQLSLRQAIRQRRDADQTAGEQPDSLERQTSALRAGALARAHGGRIATMQQIAPVICGSHATVVASRSQVDTALRTSIVTAMIRGTSTSGTIKCQKFTARVDMYKTMLVVSAALWSIYYALNHRPASGAGKFYLRRRARIRKCSALAGLTACALLVLHPGTARARPHHESLVETGAASYYGKAHQGLRTASGQRFDDRELTAAHHWLPFGTKVRVTLLHTGHSVVVKITDRLHAKRRIVDLSLAAARALGMVHQGVALVELTPR